jgi:DNA-binding MarR family transcriptional regulator
MRRRASGPGSRRAGRLRMRPAEQTGGIAERPAGEGAAVGSAADPVAGGGEDAPGAPGPRPAAVDSLLAASRVLVAVAARSLAGVADDVTVPQYRALIVLASRGPQRVADLALHLGVAPPTATRMSDRLVRKGLVERRSGVGDRRVVELALSPAGRRLVDEVTRRRRREIAAILEGVPPQRQAAMVEVLEELVEAAGEIPDRDWEL